MASDVTWRIILDDEGASASDVVDHHSTALRASSRSPGPDDRVAGPPRRRDDAHAKTVGDASLRVAKDLAGVLGIGGLTGTALRLSESFRELFAAVMAATAANSNQARAAAVGPRATPSAATGPARSTRIGEVIDAEFSVKGPAPTSPVAGPARAIADASQIPRIAGPVATQVETIGVTSAVPAVARAAAVTGPAAGAGSAAGGMAALAAAAAPVAAAFAAITGVVVGGTLVMRKSFNTLLSEGDRLAGLSGPLSGAQALSNVRSELSDIRRAQRIGPGAASLVDFKSRTSESLADIKTEILAFFGERFRQDLAPVLETIANSVGIVAGHAAVLATKAEASADWWAGRMDELGGDVANVIKAEHQLRKAMQGFLDGQKQDTFEDDPFVEAFMQHFGFGGAPPGSPQNPARGRPGPAPGVPNAGGGFGI